LIGAGLNGAVEPRRCAGFDSPYHPPICRSGARLPANDDMLAGKQGAEMNQRLWFSVALIAVVFCLWLVLSKPIC
jgi:hypothetical protein